MENTMVLSKDILMLFLRKELNGACNHRVTVQLDEGGCWTGHFIIEETNEKKEDAEYLSELAELAR